MKTKLTKPQRAWLAELAVKPRRCSVGWKPALAIEAHKFSTRHHESFGHAEFRITDAGLQWLKGHAT